MVAQNTVRTQGVNQVFRFVEDICFNLKSRQIGFFLSRKRLILLHRCVTCSKLPSNISTMHKQSIPLPICNITLLSDQTIYILLQTVCAENLDTYVLYLCRTEFITLVWRTKGLFCPILQRRQF